MPDELDLLTCTIWLPQECFCSAQGDLQVDIKVAAKMHGLDTQALLQTCEEYQVLVLEDTSNSDACWNKRTHQQPRLQHAWNHET